VWKNYQSLKMCKCILIPLHFLASTFFTFLHDDLTAEVNKEIILGLQLSHSSRFHRSWSDLLILISLSSLCARVSPQFSSYHPSVLQCLRFKTRISQNSLLGPSILPGCCFWIFKPVSFHFQLF